jgi:uncharacterized phage-associated protein
MADVFDVAAYILKKKKALTSMKLQKLVFYAQAWSLVWDEKPLFKNRIEAWANGPVVPDLYKAHRGEFMISAEPKGDPKKLTTSEKETIDIILDVYGNKSANWLSALTHAEQPWIEARKNIAEGNRSSRPISNGALADYYGNL